MGNGIQNTSGLPPNWSVYTAQPSLEEVFESTRAEASDAVLSILGGGTGVSAQSLLYLLRKRINDIDGQVNSLIKQIEVRTAEAKKLQDTMTAMRAVQAALLAQGGKDSKAKLKDIEIEGMTAYEYIDEHGIQDCFEYSSELAGYSVAEELAEKNGGVLTLETLERQIAYQHAKADSLQINKKERKARAKARELEAVRDLMLKTGENQISVEDIRKAHAEAKFSPDAVLDSHVIDQSIEKLESEIRSINSGNEIDLVDLQSVMEQRTQQVTLVTNMIKRLNDAENKIIENTR